MQRLGHFAGLILLCDTQVTLAMDVWRCGQDLYDSGAN